MRVAVVPGPGQSGLLCELDEDGGRRGRPVQAHDLSAAIADGERGGDVRWVWPATARLYPALLRAGVRVARCHDAALAGALIEGRDGSQPGPAHARELLRQVQTGSADPAAAPAGPAGLAGLAGLAAPAGTQQSLFEPPHPGETGQAGPDDLLAALIEVHAAQLAAVRADEHPDRFGLLVTAESAGGIVAAEMALAGLPWRADVHDRLLTELLGPRPAAGLGRPARLAELAAQISAAFGAPGAPGASGASGPRRRPVNPDSPGQVLRAFAADGITLPSTRLAVLSGIDHPAVPPLLEYKELSRLHSAFGWSWLDTWVAGGRFRPEYVVGGVVSGRWASRGGGALQIPRTLRRAVVADPGWVLVVADAAQLEPRVLAALAGDRAFAAAAAAGDLYAELAGAFGGDRAKAKVAMLSAMYGGAGGEAGQLLAVLRQRFPAAAGYVEAAARAGEEGRVVRSVLGRTCPPPSDRWRALTEEAADPEAERDPQAGRASRARGRFTRNFVVQASAADWALVMLVCLRARLGQIDGINRSHAELTAGRPAEHGLDGPGVDGPEPAGLGLDGPELVFFQHDEVLVHCPARLADAVCAAVAQAGRDATRLVFGATPVAFPLTVAVVSCYADAK